MGLFSSSANSAAKKAFDKYSKEYDNWKSQYGDYQKQADKAFQSDYGKSGAAYADISNKAGIRQANQQLAAQAEGATAQAQKAARMAGMGKGQAAMSGAGAANQTYQNNYAGAVNQGIGNYQNAVGQFQGQLQNRQSNALQGMGAAQGASTGAIGGMNQQTGFGNAMQLVGAAGGLASGIGGLSALSDRKGKKDIQDTEDSAYFENIMKRLRGSDERIKEKDKTGEELDLVAQVAEKINNYLYHYKPGSGEDPTQQHSGPMAQELLGVPGYQSAVIEDPSGLLKVDTSRLALANAGMIADLSKRLLMLEEIIQGLMQGPEEQSAPPPEVE